MRLATKFSAFVTSLIGLTIFVTLLDRSLNFYSVIRYKFSHRVQTMATAIDTYLVSGDLSTLGPQVIELIMLVDIAHIGLLYDDKQVYILARNDSHRSIGSNDLFHKLSVPLIRHPGMSLRLVYRDPMGNYFRSLMTTTPLTGTIGFIIVMLFLAIRWLQRQLTEQELLETRVIRILDDERGSNILGIIHEWPSRASGALGTLLREIQNAREQYSHLDTPIRSYTTQDMETNLNNRLLFGDQLAMLLEDWEKVGAHGIVTMIRLSDFNMLSDTWGHSQVEGQSFTLTNLLLALMMHYPGALLAYYHRNDFAALLPCRTLKEAESIVGQLVKAVDTLPNNRMSDHDDVIHVGICAWCGGQDTEQVMEHAESVTHNAGLQGGNSWAIYDDSLSEKGHDNVRWHTLIEQMLSRGGPHLYQRPAVTREGQVYRCGLTCRIFDGNKEISSAEYMSMILQFGLSEEYDRLQISRLILLLRYWPEENLVAWVTVESLIRSRFQHWLYDALIQCEKSQRRRMIVELTEADVDQHIDRLQPVIRSINALGVRVAVDQASLTPASTSWIKELNIELLKLHLGLVRDIRKRTENQPLVQSLVEACSGTSTQAYATGVRSQSEWQALIWRGITDGRGDPFVSSQPSDTNVKRYSQRYSV